MAKTLNEARQRILAQGRRMQQEAGKRCLVDQDDIDSCIECLEREYKQICAP